MSLKPFLFTDFWWIVNKIHVSNILMKIACIFYMVIFFFVFKIIFPGKAE